MTKIQSEEVVFRSFLDEQAETILTGIVHALSSNFLTSNILHYHNKNGVQVRMLDNINLVITAEMRPNKILGFIAAQLDCDQQIATLHIVYILRSYRQRGVQEHLLGAFDQALKSFGIEKCQSVPSSNIMLEIFRKRIVRLGETYPIEYELVLPTPEQLAWGDRNIVND